MFEFLAQDLGKEQKLNFGDDISSQLRLARKKRWGLQEEKRITQEIELQSYLNCLIKEDMEKKLEKLKLDETMNEESQEDEATKIEQECVSLQLNYDFEKFRIFHLFKANYTTELNNLFAKVDERRRKREVPGELKMWDSNLLKQSIFFYFIDHICGKISFEILQDPVITPSGITYERKDIEEHLQRVGHFDPVTRTPLSVEQLVPNFSMKEVVDTFMQENEWALEY